MLMLAAALALAGWAPAGGRAGAQAAAQAPEPAPYPELRADALVGRGTTAQAGAGVVVPMDIYVRLGIDAAAGATWRDGASQPSGRVDVVGRFLLDPFRETRLGLSFGGGLSVVAVRGDRTRPYLTAVVDLEGSAHDGITPALEVGVGGGARVGVVLRRSPRLFR